MTQLHETLTYPVLCSRTFNTTEYRVKSRQHSVQIQWTA